jgi:hypothetical protein
MGQGRTARKQDGPPVLSRWARTLAFGAERPGGRSFCPEGLAGVGRGAASRWPNVTPATTADPVSDRWCCWGRQFCSFTERVPDRQAVELVKYHLGWKLALHLRLADAGFHPTRLVQFRPRLVEHAKRPVVIGTFSNIAQIALLKKTDMLKESYLVGRFVPSPNPSWF